MKAWRLMLSLAARSSRSRSVVGRLYQARHIYGSRKPSSRRQFEVVWLLNCRLENSCALAGDMIGDREACTSRRREQCKRI